VLGLDSQHKTLSNPYNMNQIRNSVNARPLHGSNKLYSSSTMSNEQGSLHRRLDAAKNKQGFPHLRERVRVKGGGLILCAYKKLSGWRKGRKKLDSGDLLIKW